MIAIAKSLTVDFAKETLDGYRRIFSRSPLLTNLTAGWPGIYLAYDYQPPGEIPEVFAKQHGVAIFTDVPTPIQAERTLDGRFRREQVCQGDILVTPANIGSRVQWDRAGGVIYLGFDPIILNRVLWESPEADRMELVPHFATPDPLVYQLGLAMKSLLENQGASSRLYAETMASALIVHLLQYYSSQVPRLRQYPGGLSRHQLRQVITYIQEHLDQALGLDELAAIVNMSSHYFLQLFKTSTGFTPHQYVIRCRVERAQELLRQGNLTITEVARRVGFVDQSHLHRHFKHWVGVTPKTFVQQCK
jgi:AraC family transcriptional regulator